MEQEIHGTQARLHLTTTVGKLRVSHRTENITSPSYEVKDSDTRRAVTALAAVPAATLPDNTFLSALGTPAARMVPPQTGSLAQRAIEEWERNLCENKAVAILERMQAGRPALIKKDAGEMLIAIVLDRPLAETKALVGAPNAFIQAIIRIMQDKQNHPVIAQMINPEVNDDPAPSERAASSSGGHSRRSAVTRPCATKFTIPINARRQREVLTVVTHQTPATTVPHIIGATGQHEVLMVGLYTCDSAKVVSQSRSLYC